MRGTSAIEMLLESPYILPGVVCDLPLTSLERYLGALKAESIGLYLLFISCSTISSALYVGKECLTCAFITISGKNLRHLVNISFCKNTYYIQAETTSSYLYDKASAAIIKLC